jgi:flagellar biosynthesis GTPase FlhF
MYYTDMCIFNKLDEKNQLGSIYALFISNINATTVKKFTKIQLLK